VTATVRIAGPRGAQADYDLRRLGAAEYFIRRRDTGAGYVVTLREGGQWSCGCPAARYRKGPCKHTARVKEVHELLAALARPERTT